MNTSLNYFNNTVDTFRGTLDKNTAWLDDSNITTLLTLGFVIYAALFVGKIWPKGMDLFKHPLVKILSFLAVAYLANRNAGLAFVATIAIVTIMMTNLKNTHEFLEVVPKRLTDTDDHVYEAMLGKCFCSCDNTKCSCKCAEEKEPEYLHMDDVIAEEEQRQWQQQQQEQVISVQIPQDLRNATPNVAPIENIRIPMRMSEVLNEREIIAEANKVAMDKVRKQIINHEKQKNKGKLTTTYVNGCAASPYRQDATPFGRPELLDEALSYTTLDADYAPINFS